MRKKGLITILFILLSFAAQTFYPSVLFAYEGEAVSGKALLDGEEGDLNEGDVAPPVKDGNLDTVDDAASVNEGDLDAGNEASNAREGSLDEDETSSAKEGEPEAGEEISPAKEDGFEAGEEKPPVKEDGSEAGEEIPSVEEEAFYSEEDILNAEEAFLRITSEKTVMALVYLTDACPVYAEPSESAEITVYLESASTIYINGVNIKKDGLFYYGGFYVLGEYREGYIEEKYLAYSDEDLISWKEEYDELLGKVQGDFVFQRDLSSGEYPDIEQFPSGYRFFLRELKEKHEKWTFVPLKTGLDFNTAVNNEKGDKSWIYINDSNKAKGFVGEKTAQSNWAYATKAGISYYMDPRNFLTENHIFQFEQLTFNGSYHTVEAIKDFLAATFMKGKLPDDASKTYAEAFYEIGKSQKISPTHLASRVYQEQGTGTSPLISGTYKGYEGYYNYFNVGATGNTERDVIVNGLKYAKDKGWTSSYKSLSGGAQTIGNNYIKKGQDTGYLQKFNVNPSAANPVYTHQYMQNIQAPSAEALSTKKVYGNAGALNSAFVFKIPVYENMPATEYDKPLESITIKATSESNELLIGESTDVYLEYIPADTTSDLSTEWKDDSKGILKLEGNTVTALKAGTAFVSAKTGEFSASYSFTVSPCHVIFMDGGTEYGEASLSYGETLSGHIPEMTHKEGFLFTGWYTEPSGKGILAKEDTVIRQKETVFYSSYSELGRGFYIEPIGDRTYTGAAIRPDVRVYDGTSYKDGEGLIELKLNVDYTLSYGNNVKVNKQGAKNSPYVTVKGKGNYQGSRKEYFNIVAKDLRDSDITVSAIEKPYTGKSVKASPVIRRDGKKLKKDKDYTVSYPLTGKTSYVLSGTYPVVIKGKGGYKGRLTVYETITKEIFLSSVSVQKIGDKDYTGAIIEPEIKASFKGKELKLSEDGKTGDYVVEYKNNKDIGTATAVLTAIKGSGYTGTKEVSFKIKGRSIAKASVVNLKAKEFTGREEDVKQRFASEEGEDPYVRLGDEVLNFSADGTTGDYIVSYKNIGKTGTATVTVKGINAFTGTIKKTYKIKPCDLESAGELIKLSYHTQDKPDTETEIAELSEIKCAYLKGGAMPAVALQNTLTLEMLRPGKDFKISYANKGNISTAETPDNKLPKITITGKGNYTGKLSGYYEIETSGFEEDKISLSAPDIVYSKKKKAALSAPVLKDIDGKKLKEGTDYQILSYNYVSLADNEVMQFKREAEIRAEGDEVGIYDIPDAGTVISVTVEGKGKYASETRSCVYRIVKANLSSAQYKVKTKVYDDGKDVTLEDGDIVYVKIGNTELVRGTDFVIDEHSYKNNKNKGTASVIIRAPADGNYGGSKTIKFKIDSKKFSFWD